MRTIPAYIVALSFAAIIFDFGSSLNFVRFLTYTQNIFIDNPNPNFFSVAWSLSVEEWFYIIIPLLIWLSVKSKMQNKLLFICSSIVIFGFVSKIIFSPAPELWGESIRRSVIFRIDSLCYGVIAYLLRDKIQIKLPICLIFLFLIFISFISLNPLILTKNLLLQILFLPICSISFSSLLIILSKIKISPKLANVGSYLANLSYSMYLFHIFFIIFLSPFLAKTNLEFWYTFFLLFVIQVFFIIYLNNQLM